jgi:hypothetical protein
MCRARDIKASVRLPAFLLAIAATAFVASCYDPPAIPKDRPLPCSSTATEECPKGFVCVGNRFCAPRTCRETTDCPIGLTCAGSRGCVFIGAETDGGTGAAASDAVVPFDDARPAPSMDAASGLSGDR